MVKPIAAALTRQVYQHTLVAVRVSVGGFSFERAITMPFPFQILDHKRVPGRARDIETFISDALGQQAFTIEKSFPHKTDKIFDLHFKQRVMAFDYMDDDGKYYMHWGGAKLVDYTDETEITMWASKPDNVYIGTFSLDEQKVMEERFGWLEELSREILEHFKKPEPAEKTKRKPWNDLMPDTQRRYSEAWNIYLAMCKEYKEDFLDGQTRTAKPTISDWKIRDVQKVRKYGRAWNVTERTLETVKSYGEARDIPKKNHKK